MKRVLGIDPGTNCGWALFNEGKTTSGVWNLRGGRFEGGGMRYLRMANFLKEVSKEGKLDRLYFEEVRRHLGTTACHVYGGIVAVITAYCEENEIPYAGIPVGTVKKFGCGKGNASKEEMIDAAVKLGFSPEDDNEADAIHILRCGMSME